MNRPGNPERWEREFHRALKPAEQEIMARAIESFPGGFEASDVVAAGAAKSHRSAQLWINRLEAGGLLEKFTAGNRFLWSVTDYGRWMVRDKG